MNWRMTMFVGLLLIGTVWANADSKSDYPVLLKIMSAKTESLPTSSGSNDVPTACDGVNFSAYCHETRTAVVRNTMLVKDSSGKSFTISCTVDSRWSNCISLPVGETFGAEKEKHGFTVWYQNSKGKEVKQSYALVTEADKSASPSKAQPSSPTESPASNAAPATATPVSDVRRDTIKCTFTSTPAGAEITIDGRYAGNTPSSVGVAVGTHVVVLSIPGFVNWKRELAVTYGSDLNVSATLQKTPE
jgi:PEGA domain